MPEWMDAWMNQWVNEYKNERTKKGMNEWFSKHITMNKWKGQT